MKSNNKKNFIFLSALFLVILTSFGWLCFKIVSNINDIKKLSLIVGDGREQAEQIANLKKNFEKFRPEIESVDSHLVKNNEEVVFIEELEQLAKNEGLTVEISSVSIDKPINIAPSGLEYLVLSIKTTGSWSGNFRFLSLLESMPYDINLNKASLIYNKDDTGISGWRGVFNVKILKKNK